MVTRTEVAEGEYVYFGRYGHSTGTKDAYEGTKKPILWRMLSDTRLWSVYFVDKKWWNFDIMAENSAHWTGVDDDGLSTLRPWLNNATDGFIGKAFTKAEQSRLKEGVDNDIEAKVTILDLSTLPGNERDDIRKGAYLGQAESSEYWTRTPEDFTNAYLVDAGGDEGREPVVTELGVRPACRLKLESFILKSVSDSSSVAAEAGGISNPYFLYLPVGTVTPETLTVVSTTAFADELTIKFTTTGAYNGQIYHAYSGTSASGTDLAGKFLVNGVAPTNATVSGDSVILTLTNPIAPGDSAPLVAYTVTDDADSDAIGYVTATPALVPTTLGAVSIAAADVTIKPYLTNLTISSGTLTFDKKTFTYTVSVPNSVASVTLTPKAAGTGTTITVDGNDVGSGNASSAIQLTAGQSKTIDVVLLTADAQTATYSVAVTRAATPPPPPPSDPLTSPTITTQPNSAAARVGESAAFTVAATGNPTPTYQWQSSADGTTWTDIADATGATLTLQNLTLAQSGNKYRCIASNSDGSSTSDAASLTVSEVPVAPTIKTQPSATAVRAGETAKFSITATGIPTPTYQWQESVNGTTWSDITGATSADLTLQSATLAQSGTQYRCTATNSEGSKTSSAATLTVWEITAVTATPASFASSGGIGEVEIAGTNLPTGLTVAAFDGTTVTTITGTTTGDESSRKATLSYPPNASITEDKVYTIKASLGGTDYIDTPTATVTVNSAANDEPTEREFFTILEAECEIRYVRNADGTYRVEVLIPLLAGSNPSLIETITATLTGRGYTDITYSFVDEDGVETPIVSAAARGAISAPYLKISFTAPDGTVLDEGVLVKLDYTLADEATGEATDYVQIFPDGGLKFSAIEQTDTTPTGGSSGCATGAGIFALAILGITLLRRRRYS